ncbi:MAG: PspC domain-containing protein [Bacteroidetes bacterium]|nr:PspC domain-containing protein [Bacteroidota bacterium]
MKKTFTINISGIIFNIDDDAYEKLRDYLSKVSNRFSEEEGRSEIMADIESRIAEILNERVGTSKQVVVMNDVDHVIGLMGAPEDMGDGEPEKEKQDKEEENNNRERDQLHSRRRLYRDPDDKVIGGVCSGLGYYFDVDPVWIRIGFAVIFFAFGTGLLFYLLLVIIIPKAETTSEKLEMRGEPVDLNNISRSIREEFDGVKKKVKDFGNETKRRGSRWRDETRDWSRRNRTRDGFEDFFHGVFRIFGRVVAFALIFFGIIFLIGLLTSTFSLAHFSTHLFGRTVRNFFSDGFHYTIAVIAVFLAFGIPILMMIYKGIRMMFRIQRRDRAIGITALVLWIAGIVLVIFSGISVARSFSEQTSVHEIVHLPDAHADTLVLRADIDKEMENTDYFSPWNKRHHIERRSALFSMNGEDLKLGFPKLSIVPSTSDSIELVVFRSAHGWNKQDALVNAKAILYPVEVKNNTLIFPDHFTIGNGATWRGQDVYVELRLPVNEVIDLNSSLEEILNEADNTSNAIPGQMLNRRWKMTAEGLTCIDCAGLDVSQVNNSSGKINIPAKKDSVDSVKKKK